MIPVRWRGAPARHGDTQTVDEYDGKHQQHQAEVSRVCGAHASSVEEASIQVPLRPPNESRPTAGDDGRHFLLEYGSWFSEYQNSLKLAPCLGYPLEKPGIGLASERTKFRPASLRQRPLKFTEPRS